MLTITTSTGKYLRYVISGTLTREDLSGYYRQLDLQYAEAGKLDLLAVVKGFRGYAGPLALATVLLHEHKVIRKAARYAAVTDQKWFARLIRLINRLVPAMEVAAFTEEEEAKAWLGR